MNEAIVKIDKRFIKCISKIQFFFINIFIMIHVKGKVDLLDKMFKGVNRIGWKCVTSFFNAHFERKVEQPMSNILTMNFAMS